MNEETYGCVNSVCYLGDTGDGGADLAATSRIRNGWMKIQSSALEMKGRVYASCVRSTLLMEVRPGHW